MEQRATPGHADTREAAYRPIGFVGASERQFRLLWASRRPILLAIGLLGLLGIAGEPWTESPLARLLTPWPVWVTLIGPIWALAVWHNEGPSARHYFWAQPVSRRAHTMARVAAGAAWLWVIYLFLILAALLIGLADGEAGQLALISPLGWLNFFTGPLLGYLAVTVLAIPSDHPIRWLFGLIFLVPLTLSLLDEWLGLDRFVRWLVRPLANEDWGMGITLLGGWGDAVTRAQHMVAMGETGTGLGTAFSPATWALATALWAAFWIAVIVLLAGRHPDTLPRLRRSG